MGVLGRRGRWKPGHCCCCCKADGREFLQRESMGGGCLKEPLCRGGGLGGCRRRGLESWRGAEKVFNSIELVSASWSCGSAGEHRPEPGTKAEPPRSWGGSTVSPLGKSWSSGASLSPARGRALEPWAERVCWRRLLVQSPTLRGRIKAAGSGRCGFAGGLGVSRCLAPVPPFVPSDVLSPSKCLVTPSRGSDALTRCLRPPIALPSLVPASLGHGAGAGQNHCTQQDRAGPVTPSLGLGRQGRSVKTPSWWCSGCRPRQECAGPWVSDTSRFCSRGGSGGASVGWCVGQAVGRVLLAGSRFCLVAPLVLPAAAQPQPAAPRQMCGFDGMWNWVRLSSSPSPGGAPGTLCGSQLRRAPHSSRARRGRERPSSTSPSCQPVAQVKCPTWGSSWGGLGPALGLHNHTVHPPPAPQAGRGRCSRQAAGHLLLVAPAGQRRQVPLPPSPCVCQRNLLLWWFSIFFFFFP